MSLFVCIIMLSASSRGRHLCLGAVQWGTAVLNQWIMTQQSSQHYSAWIIMDFDNKWIILLIKYIAQTDRLWKSWLSSWDKSGISNQTPFVFKKYLFGIRRKGKGPGLDFPQLVVTQDCYWREMWVKVTVWLHSVLRWEMLSPRASQFCLLLSPNKWHQSE